MRQALDLAFDFQWLNRQLFFNQYTRIDSFFANTDLQATGMPSAGELAILAPLRAQLDPAVFGPTGEAAGHGSARFTAREPDQARASCWPMRAGPIGTARCVTQRASRSCSRFLTTRAVERRWNRCRHVQRNLQKLGIVANFRTVDFALIQKRLDAFDFDMTSLRMPDVQVPGTEQDRRFGSKSADTQGSDNYDRAEVAGRRHDRAYVGAGADARATSRRHSRARPGADAWLLCGPALVHGVAQGGVSKHACVSGDACRCTTERKDWITSTWWYASRTAAVAATAGALKRQSLTAIHTGTAPMWSYILKRLLVDDPDLARRPDADLRRDPVRAGRPGRTMPCTNCAKRASNGAPFGYAHA